MINGNAKKTKPPQIINAKAGGSATVAESMLELYNIGTAFQEGITSVTHIKALASAPP